MRSRSRREMSSRWPMRDGRPLKNQTCETGEASSMCPMRSRRPFDAALVADHAAVLHALVLAAEALPVGDRAEDLGAEEAVALRFEGAVVDRLRLPHFAVRPRADLFRRGEGDLDGVEVIDRLLLGRLKECVKRFQCAPPLFLQQFDVETE